MPEWALTILVVCGGVGVLFLSIWGGLVIIDTIRSMWRE